MRTIFALAGLVCFAVSSPSSWSAIDADDKEALDALIMRARSRGSDDKDIRDITLMMRARCTIESNSVIKQNLIVHLNYTDQVKK